MNLIKKQEIKRKLHIQDRLMEHYFRAKSLGYEVFAIIIQGSQNYNMDKYDPNVYVSDIDTRCIVLPKFDDFCKKVDGISFTYEFPENKEHIDIKDIENMFSLWKKANVQFLELLFSDYYYVPDKYKGYWDRLREMGEKIVKEHKSSLYNAIYGMAMQKYEALTHPYPTIKWKIDKFGYDPKQAHHIYRLYHFITDYQNTGSFKNSLVPKDEIIDYLINMKIDGLDWNVNEVKFNCKSTCNMIKEIKDKQIEMYGKDESPFETDTILDNMRVDILKEWFREEINK